MQVPTIWVHNNSNQFAKEGWEVVQSNNVLRLLAYAMIKIISKPVNSTVSIVDEVLKFKSVYDPRKLFGVTTLDVVRANTFVAEKLGLIDVDVPVIGGHAGITILPSLSKTKPTVEFTPEEIGELMVCIQNVSTEVVDTKAGVGSAILSMVSVMVLFKQVNCFK